MTQELNVRYEIRMVHQKKSDDFFSISQPNKSLESMGLRPVTQPPALLGSKGSHLFRLQVPKIEIKGWAARYLYPGEAELIAGPVTAARDRGYLRRDEFLEISRWKSSRTRSLSIRNDAAFIEEVTRLALLPDTSARLSVESLTLLSGVGWPTASVILHFCHQEPYPILDFRALWSVGYENLPAYSYGFWAAYTNFTRALCETVGCDIRILDRALWQYSKERQE